MKSIIELAREAGFNEAETEILKQEITSFAALVRKQALEEAAEFVDRNALHCHDNDLLQVVLKVQAAAIRALKIKDNL